MSLNETRKELKCNHLWVAGGLKSDWICEHCGAREDIAAYADNHTNTNTLKEKNKEKS